MKVMFLHLSVILFTAGVSLPHQQTAIVSDGTHPTGMHSCHSFVFTSNVCRKQDLFEIDFRRLISMKPKCYKICQYSRVVTGSIRGNANLLSGKFLPKNKFMKMKKIQPKFYSHPENDNTNLGGTL